MSEPTTAHGKVIAGVMLAFGRTRPASRGLVTPEDICAIEREAREPLLEVERRAERLVRIWRGNVEIQHGSCLWEDIEDLAKALDEVKP